MFKNFYILLIFLIPFANYGQGGCDGIIIIPFLTTDNVSCFNAEDGSIEVIFENISGGDSPYSVSWAIMTDPDGDGIFDVPETIIDLDDDGILSGLSSGVYEITITDSNGCSGLTQTAVQEPLEIILNYDTTEILCYGDQSVIDLGIDGNIMNYDVNINGEYIETVLGGSPTITDVDDFDYTNTGSNNTIVIFGCDDADCSDANGIITPGDVIGVFYENVLGNLECGGSATFNGTIPFVALSGWQTEFGMDNGFDDEDPYIWYLYDSSGDIYELIPSYDLVQGVDYFTPGGFTIIDNFSIGTVLGSNDDFSYTTGSGEYLIELVGENGCTGSETIIIEEPNELIIIEESVVNPTCGGAINGLIDITVTGGTGVYTYEWTGPLGDIISSDEDLFNLSPGDYSVVVTDENNCVSEDLYTITNPSNINVSYTYEPIICNGESTILTIDVSGGEPPYSIDYNGEDPNNIYGGFYTFSVTDELGCLESFDVSIVNPDGIAINYPAVETVCYGEVNIPVDFSMSISGGSPPYDYEWFDESGVTLGIFSPSAILSPGNYSIVVTDDNNCPSIPSNFTISEPEQIVVDYELDAINCFGEMATANFTIDGAPGSYTIYFNSNEETNTIGLSDISFDWVNTGVNSSIVISEVTGLTLNDGDLIGVFYTSGSGVQCGGSTIFNESDGFPISLAAWGEEPGEDNGFENGEEFLFLINSGGLVYEVEVIFNLDVTGFTDVFEINGLSQVENMNVIGVFSDGPDFSFSNLEENNYLVEIVDGNGCSWDSTIVINGVDELLVFNEIVNDASCFGELAEITSNVSGGQPPYSFQWQNILTNQIVSVQPEPDLEAGSYFFIVTDDNNCVVANLVDVPQQSGEIIISSESEICENENNGIIEGCVDWEGEISFFLFDNTGLVNQIDLMGDGIETCYMFSDLSPGTYNLEATSINGCNASEEVIVDSADSIFVAFDTTPSQCFGEPLGSIIIDNNGIIGGDPPFEIDWNGVDTENIYSGFYSFVITDASGCSKTFNYFIGESQSINTNPSIDNNSCYGEQEGSINLSVSGGNPGATGFSYVWTNSAGNMIGFESSIENLFSDTYIVEITDSFGCTYIEEFEIIDENEEITVLTTSTPSDCFAGMGEVSASIFEGNNSNFSFIWPNGINNNGESVFLYAGDYELSVIENSTGCIIQQPFTILEPEELIIALVYEEILCFEDFNGDGLNDITTSVNAIVYGGADNDTDGDGIPNYVVGETEPYDQDIDNDGIVNSLDDDIDGDDIPNELDDDGLIWIDGDIDNDGIVNDEDVDWNGEEVFVDHENLTPGIYFVYTYDSNGCYSITEFEINSPDDFIVIASPNQILCFGEFGSSDLSISGGIPPYEITWTNQLTGSEVDPSELLEGTYSIEVLDQNECVQKDFITIDSEPEELLIDNLEISDYNGFEVSCNGYSDGSINVTVVGGVAPYTYEWVGPNGFFSSDEDIINLFAGIYELNITDANGCQLYNETELLEPDVFSVLFYWAENAHCEDADDGSIIITTNGGNPPFNYTVNNVVYSGGLVNTNITTDEIFLEDENSIVIPNLTIGPYSINIESDEFGCITPELLNMHVGFDDENCLWIPSVFTPNTDGVNDTFQIYGMEYYPNAVVQVYDRWGVKIYESKNQLYVPWDGTSNGKQKEIGTYYYVIELNTGQKTYSGSITLKR